MGRSSGLGVRVHAGGSGLLQPESQHHLHTRAETPLGSCGGHGPSTWMGSHLSRCWREGLRQLAGMEQAKPGTQQGPQRAGAAPHSGPRPESGPPPAHATAVTGVVLKEPPPSSGRLAPLRSCTPTAVSPKGRSRQAETGPTRKLHA